MKNQRHKVAFDEAAHTVAQGLAKQRNYEPDNCAACKKWLRGDGATYRNSGIRAEDLVASWGVCTENPAWLPTHAQHYCAHFVADFSGKTILQITWPEAQADERGRRIALEKTVKALRAELRAAKAKAPAK